MTEPVTTPAADGKAEFQFGRYRVLGLLGTGGMATVYRAEDPLTGQIVALKVMSRDLEGDPEYRARFVREARMLQVIRHPNVVQVLDAGEEGGRPYFVMECLQGEDLEQRIRRDGPLPWRMALELMRQALKGLAAAWSAGLIHRDVKPENLFIADGVLKVMDFGVARPLLSDGFQTQAGMVVGTPAYIAPEQAMGRKVDLRADLYSLGATFFHVISGRTPYGEAQPSQLCASHVYDPFPPITQFCPDLPPGVAALFARLAEKDPTKRGDQLTTMATIEDLMGLAPESMEPVVEGPALVVHAGLGIGTRAPLPEGVEVIIGRMPGCGLTIDDARASRRHASVTRMGKEAEVKDLGSRNGILVNGLATKQAKLREGDLITIGDTVVRLEGLNQALLSPRPPSSPGDHPGFPQPSTPPPAVRGAPQRRDEADVVIQRGAFGPGLVMPTTLSGAGSPPVPGDKPAEVHHSRAEQATFESVAEGRLPGVDVHAGHLKVLCRLAAASRGARGPEELARRILQVLVEAIPSDRGMVLLQTGPAADAAGLKMVASRDVMGQPVGGGPHPALLKLVWDQKQSTITSDAVLGPLGPGAPQRGANVILAAPLAAGDAAVGLVVLERSAPRTFSPEELVTLESAAGFCATDFLLLSPGAANGKAHLVRDLLALMSPAMRAELESRGEPDLHALLAPRHLQAAVLFCDLKDFSLMSERLSPADGGALLGSFIRIVTEALAAERGFLCRTLGEECLGVFGAPVAVDNPSFHAVKAGATILQGVVALQRTLPQDRKIQCRVAIHTGQVLAGAVGTDRKQEYSVVGEPVGIATTLGRQAGGPMLLVGESTFKDLKGAVPAIPRGALTLRPRNTSLNVYEIPPPGPVSRPAS